MKASRFFLLRDRSILKRLGSGMPICVANTDPLGNGWFFKVHVTDMGEFDQLMDQPAYDVLVKNS